MKTGRWIAVVACSGLVALATGMLYYALSRGIDADSPYRFFPYFALAFLAVTPMLASGLSGSATWFAAGAGGLAVSIAVTVLAAGLDSGGNGVMPLTLGIALGGVVGLRADSRTAIWLRLGGVVLLAVYAATSGRLLSFIFVYPLLGFADEFGDAIASRSDRDKQRPVSTLR
jgi:hypothetical protein